MNQLEMALDESEPALHEYTVKVSARARNVSLQVLPLVGLQVTIPTRFPRREIPRLLRDNHRWIAAQFKRVEQDTDPEFRVWPPQILKLRSIGVNLQVQFCELDKADSPRACIEEEVLRVYGCGASWAQSHKGRDNFLRLLAKVLKAEARRHFEPLVSELAQLHGLHFKRVSIRGQRTLWGSYSSSGTLSLNYKLLFLPPEYLRYTILHELAHTVHLNHSAQFWCLLESLEPHARRLDKSLNTVGKLVPPWL